MAPHASFMCLLSDASLPTIIQQYESTTFKKNFYNQNKRFPLQMEAIMCLYTVQLYHKIDTFCGEWDTKEDTGKSM